MKIASYELLDDSELKQLGLIVLQSDVTLEDEFRRYFSNSSMSILVNRIPFENEVTRETLQQMEAHIADTMSLFPLTSRFDSLGYACTSGAMHIGSKRIAQLAQQQRPCKQTSNPMDAVIKALRHIGAKKIAFLAPYSRAVSQTMVDRIESEGFSVECSATFDECEDAKVGRISPSSIFEAAVSLCQDHQPDAVFMACTNMKCIDIIPKIEAQTGVTALSSNLALAWDMARLAGMPLNQPSLGRILCP